MGVSDGFRISESGYGRLAALLLWVVWVCCMAMHGAQAYSSGLSCVLLCLPVLVIVVALLRGGRLVRVPAAMWFFLVAGGGYFLVRCAMSYNVYDAWNEAAHVLAAMVFYLAGFLYAPSKDGKGRLLVAVGAAVLLQVGAMAVVGMGEVPSPVGRPLFSLEGTMNAAHSLFGYKNFTAAFLVVCGVFSLTYALVEGGRRSLGWWAVAVVAFSASFFCSSRAPWMLVPLAVAVACCFWLMSRVFAGRSAVAAGVCLAVLVLAGTVGLSVLLAQDGGADRLAHWLDSHDRLYLSSLALDAGERAPWFGNGARSFVWEALPMSWTKYAPNYAHNEYLQMFADYGLAGCVLLLAALVVHVWMGLQRLGCEEGRRPALVAAAMAGFAMMALYAGLDFVWHSMGLLAVAAFCAGVMAAPCKPPLRAESKAGRGVLLGVGAAVLAGLVFLSVQLFPTWCRQWGYSELVDARVSVQSRAAALSSVVAGYKDPLVVNEYVRLLAEASPSVSAWEAGVRRLDESLAFNPKYLYNAAMKADLLDRLGRFREAESVHRRLHVPGGMVHNGIYPWRPVYALHLADWGMSLVKSDPNAALSLLQSALPLMNGMVDGWAPAQSQLRMTPAEERRAREMLQTTIWYLKTAGAVPDGAWKASMAPGEQGALYQRR